MRDPQLTAGVELLSDRSGILRFSGEIDMATGEIVTGWFDKVAREGITDLILDMTKVTFMDSTGIHALVGAKRAIHQNGSRIILIPSSPVRKILDLAAHVMDAQADSLDEALAMLKADAN